MEDKRREKHKCVEEIRRLEEECRNLRPDGDFFHHYDVYNCKCEKYGDEKYYDTHHDHDNSKS